MPQFDNTTPHLSSVYDQQVRQTIPYYESFHRETLHLVRAINPQPRIWLDTGCGTGTLIETAMLQFPDTLFLGVDPAVEMLRQAQKKFSGTLPRQVEFLEPASSQEIHLPPAKDPDVITAIQAHHYLKPEPRRQAVQHCFDLLKPGGLLITFENIRPATESGIAIGKTLWSNFQLDCGKEPSSVAAHLARFDVEYFPITVAQHLKLMNDCGFQTVELFWYSYLQAGFYGIK